MQNGAVAFAKEVEIAMERLLKTLPRRLYDGDRDQAWRISMNGGSKVYAQAGKALTLVGKVVPIYQSGWEGVGVFMATDVGDFTVAEPAEVAAKMLAMAASKIRSDDSAVGIVEGG